MASKRGALDPLGPCAKLMRLGKASFVSQSGIAKLLKVVEDEGTPSAFSRVTQWRARKATRSTPTAYGPLVNEVALELTDGKVVTVGMQNCWAMPSPRRLIWQRCFVEPSTSTRPHPNRGG